jgi:hypothetical protein
LLEAASVDRGCVGRLRADAAWLRLATPLPRAFGLLAVSSDGGHRLAKASRLSMTIKGVVGPRHRCSYWRCVA